MSIRLLKKLFLSVISIILIIGIIGTPNLYADDPSYTITINKKPNDDVEHHYEAYQIFAGDLYVKEANDKTLSNITWGSGVKNAEAPNDLLTALKADTTIGTMFQTCTTPREVAVVLEDFTNDDASLKAFAEVVSGFLNEPSAKTSEIIAGNYQIQVTEPGYYFIKDADNSLEGDDSAYTRYILEVVANVTIDPKSSKPTVDKSLNLDGNVDIGSHEIYEKFNYYLTANLPESTEYAEYDKYQLIFEDTLEDGITYDQIISVKAKVKDSSEEINLVEGTDYNTVGTEGQTIKITIPDLKGSLNKNDADITKGVDVIVTYSAFLNEKAKISKPGATDTPNINAVKIQYSNNPNASGTGSTGTTVDSETYVFTYGINNTKYADKADAENILPGAKFRLYRDAEKSDEVKLIWDASLNAYRPAKEGIETADAIESRQDDGEFKGTFNIVGLSEGTYYLAEVVTPPGYYNYNYSYIYHR